MILKKSRYVVNCDSVNVGHIYKQLFIALLAASSCFSYGIQSAWVSPMQKLLKSDASPLGRPLTNTEITLVTTIMTAAAILGSFMFMFAADAYGRKFAYIFALSLQAISWILLLISSHIAAFYIARISAGMGGAGAGILVPMYIKETCRDNLRGTLVILCFTLQYTGILFIYIIASYLKYYTVSWICLCIPTITIILVIFVATETPPFLVKIGKIEEATAAVANIRGLNINHKTVQHEIDYMKSQDLQFKTMKKITFSDILKNKAWRRGWLLCSLVMIGVSVNGTFSITTYAFSLITECGISISPKLQTLSVPILMVIGSIILLISVDRMGRKLLLGGNFLLTFVSLSVLASFFLMRDYGVAFPNFVPVVAMAGAVCAYAMGVMSVPHVIMTEMFRFEVRAKIISCVISLVWISVSIQIAFYDYMSRIIGIYGVFYIFAAVNLSSALLVFIFVPETKGRTVEKIEDMLLRKKNVSDNS